MGRMCFFVLLVVQLGITNCKPRNEDDNKLLDEKPILISDVISFRNLTGYFGRKGTQVGYSGDGAASRKTVDSNISNYLSLFRQYPAVLDRLKKLGQEFYVDADVEENGRKIEFQRRLSLGFSEGAEKNGGFRVRRIMRLNSGDYVDHIDVDLPTILDLDKIKLTVDRAISVVEALVESKKTLDFKTQLKIFNPASLGFTNDLLDNLTAEQSRDLLKYIGELKLDQLFSRDKEINLTGESSAQTKGKNLNLLITNKTPRAIFESYLKN